MQAEHLLPPEKHSIETVRIEKFDSLGNGLGKLDSGQVIFISGALPGELIRARVPRKDGNYKHGRLLEIIEPSPLRIPPRCPYFSECALCAFQTLKYPDQLEAKYTILCDQLKRIGKIDFPSRIVSPLIGSPAEFEYRFSMQFRVMGNGSFALPGRNRGLLPVQFCPACKPEINDLLKTVAFDSESGIQKIEIRLDCGGEPQLILYGDEDRPQLDLETDLPVSIVYIGTSGSVVMAGDSSARQQIGDLDLVIAENSDFVPNPEGINALLVVIKRELASFCNKDILIIRAGTGLWAKWAGSFCREVIVVEQEDAYLDDFLLNLSESDNVSLFLGDPEDIIPNLKRNVDLVLFDAMNTPIRKEHLLLLCNVQPERIVGIYRDSALLSRDTVSLMNAGFELEKCIPLDDLPQTEQFTIVGLFKNKNQGAKE